MGDIVQSYHHIPVAAADIHRTAVIRLFRMYKFVRMSFRLKNAPQPFQWWMYTAFLGLNLVYVYLDDISATSRDKKKNTNCIFAGCFNTFRGMA